MADQISLYVQKFAANSSYFVVPFIGRSIKDLKQNLNEASGPG
jgi:hypothetical protein